MKDLLPVLKTRLTTADYDRAVEYAERHGLTLAELGRLAVLTQIDRPPRGIERARIPRGNPAIAEQSAKGVAARLRKRNQSRNSARTRSPRSAVSDQ